MFDMKRMLERLKLTQDSLARKAGVHPNTLNYGKRKGGVNDRTTSPETMRKVADALDQHAALIKQEASALRVEADRRDPRVGAPPATENDSPAAGEGGGFVVHVEPASPAPVSSPLRAVPKPTQTRSSKRRKGGIDGG